MKAAVSTEPYRSISAASNHRPQAKPQPSTLPATPKGHRSSSSLSLPQLQLPSSLPHPCQHYHATMIASSQTSDRSNRRSGLLSQGSRTRISANTSAGVDHDQALEPLIPQQIATMDSTTAIVNNGRHGHAFPHPLSSSTSVDAGFNNSRVYTTYPAAFDDVGSSNNTSEAATATTTAHRYSSRHCLGRRNGNGHSDSDEDDHQEEPRNRAKSPLQLKYDPTLPEHTPNCDPYCHTIYLAEEGLTITIRGMQYAWLRNAIYTALSILSCGILALLGRWLPRWRVRATMKPTPLDSAPYVLVSDNSGSNEVVLQKVQHIDFSGPLESIFGALTLVGPFTKERNSVISKIVMFTFRYYRLIYHPLLRRYLPTYTWRSTAWVEDPLSCRRGLNCHEQRKMRRVIFGDNMIAIAEKSTLQILIDEVLHPFYIFQIFSIVLWLFDNYYIYASCIFVMSTVSIAITLTDTRRNTRRINEMARFACLTTVYRNGGWMRIPSDELLPGDVVEVSDPGLVTMPCDALLLEGECIVNESMLTGESIPVAKSPVTRVALQQELDLSETIFKPEMSKHALFSGTKLVRVKKSHAGFGGKLWLDEGHAVPTRATALVLRTGFNTTKGALVRSILYPRPNNFEFYRDSFRFIGCLSLLALIGFLASLANFIRLHISTHTIILRALDLITVVVPPALPATMSVGVSFALARLRKKMIFCISPTRINVSGKLNAICFDKTGTLTEDGLDVLGAQRVVGDKFEPMIENVAELSSREELLHKGVADTLDNSSNADGILLIHALATCHSLKLVDGELIGDPLDVRMFESTQWILEEGDERSAHPDHRRSSSSIIQPRHRISHAEHGEAIAEQRLDQLSRSHPGPVPTVVRPPFSREFSLNLASLPPPPSNGGDHLRDNHPYELGIIRTFDFVPALRRMCVVARHLQAKHMEVYVKGAPEAIRDLCIPSTLPSDFNELLDQYTHHGYRVIAVGGKRLTMSWPKVQRLSRDQLERDLTFLGFIVFENKLKPTTTPVLRELRDAGIRQIMCTGDNVLTAVSVARECGLADPSLRVFYPRLVPMTLAPEWLCMSLPYHRDTLGNDGDGPTSRSSPSGTPSPVRTEAEQRVAILWEDFDKYQMVLDPITLRPLVPSGTDLYASMPAIDYELAQSGHYCLAVTGEVFREIIDRYPKSTVDQMLMRGIVYARMSPDEKAELVEKLQGLKYCTGFCGDGANDCSALKAADVGISLSEAEASVAAPFVSKSTDIYCVLDVIRDGRAALVTSFSCFKFMALYSLIQFTSVCMMYSYGGGLGDYQFLYIDLFLILPVAVFMSNSPGYHRIVRKSPTARLVSKKVLTSLLGQAIIIAAFQAGMFMWTRAQPWYVPPDPSEYNEGNSSTFMIKTFENTTVFLVSCYQYIFMSIVFNQGPPYRRRAIRNIGFLASCAVLFVLTIYINMGPNRVIRRFMELREIPLWSRGIILVYSIVNFAVSYGCEHWVFPRLAPYAAFAARFVRSLVGIGCQRVTEFALSHRLHSLHHRSNERHHNGPTRDRGLRQAMIWLWRRNPYHHCKATADDRNEARDRGWLSATFGFGKAVDSPTPSLPTWTQPATSFDYTGDACVAPLSRNNNNNGSSISIRSRNNNQYMAVDVGNDDDDDDCDDYGDLRRQRPVSPTASKRAAASSVVFMEMISDNSDGSPRPLSWKDLGRKRITKPYKLLWRQMGEPDWL